jgi:hypothetical protein
MRAPAAQRSCARAAVRAATAFLLAAIAAAAGPPAARAAPHDEIRIIAIEPARSDTTLVCSVRTRGLPGTLSRQTLESGLPSAILLAFTLLDPSGRERGGSQVEVRIEPDLLENGMLVRTPLLDRRVGTMEGVIDLMSHLGPFPVAPLRRLGSGQSMRVRVRLAVHPLAPAEIRRVHALFGGEPDPESSDRREVSTGVGALLRFFLGREREDGWAADATSPPFTSASLAERQALGR